MRYNYLCKKCGTDHKPFIFEVSHGMKETPVVKCPKCDGTDTVRTLIGVEHSFWIRGYGYMDVEGRRRDMHRWKLINDDPYRHMRQPGEAASLAEDLKRGGKRKTNRKHVVISKKGSMS